MNSDRIKAKLHECELKTTVITVKGALIECCVVTVDYEKDMAVCIPKKVMDNVFKGLITFQEVVNDPTIYEQIPIKDIIDVNCEIK